MRVCVTRRWELGRYHEGVGRNQVCKCNRARACAFKLPRCVHVSKQERKEGGRDDQWEGKGSAKRTALRRGFVVAVEDSCRALSRLHLLRRPQATSMPCAGCCRPSRYCVVCVGGWVGAGGERRGGGGSMTLSSSRGCVQRVRVRKRGRERLGLH